MGGLPEGFRPPVPLGQPRVTEASDARLSASGAGMASGVVVGATPRETTVSAFALLALLIAAMTGSAVASGPAPAQGLAPRFPVAADLVVVDAVVVDGDGRPVAGLSREAFELLEDGRLQPITSFEAIEVPTPRPGPVAARRPRVSSNLVPLAATTTPGRSFVVVFDELNLTAAQAQQAKRAVTAFLNDGVGEGDRVTIVATASRAWWTARLESGREELLGFLEGLQGRLVPDVSGLRLTDYEAMRIHLFEDTLVGERVRRRFWQQGVDPYDPTYHLRERLYDETPGLNHPMVRARAAEVYRDLRERSGSTLELVERALQSLSATRGRKSLILVSKGFVYDPKLSSFGRVLEASRRANAALYFLDARGLVGGATENSAEWQQPVFERDVAFPAQELALEAEGSESLAARSGGFSIKNTNDLASGIERIARESRSYYLLGYRPQAAPLDGRYHRLAIRVRRDGWRVRARKGYYALAEGEPSPPAKGVTDLELLRLAEVPLEATGIPLALATYALEDVGAGEVRVLTAVDVGVRDPAFETTEGRPTVVLDLLLLVTHRETGRVYPHREKLTIPLLPETREAVLREGYSFARSLDLPPGTCQARLVVREPDGARWGSLVHTFEVPPRGEWRISTPILSDRLHGSRGSLAERPRPIVVARRAFRTSSTLFCAFDVYRSAQEAATGLSRVSAGYEIRRSDGLSCRRRELTPISPGSAGAVSRLMGLPLDGCPPGEYELVMDVRDEIGGAAQRLREPFQIVCDEPTRSE